MFSLAFSFLHNQAKTFITTRHNVLWTYFDYVLPQRIALCKVTAVLMIESCRGVVFIDFERARQHGEVQFAAVLTRFLGPEATCASEVRAALCGGAVKRSSSCGARVGSKCVLPCAEIKLRARTLRIHGIHWDI